MVYDCQSEASLRISREGVIQQSTESYRLSTQFSQPRVTVHTEVNGSINVLEQLYDTTSHRSAAVIKQEINLMTMKGAAPSENDDASIRRSLIVKEKTQQLQLDQVVERPEIPNGVSLHASRTNLIDM